MVRTNRSTVGGFFLAGRSMVWWPVRKWTRMVDDKALNLKSILFCAPDMMDINKMTMPDHLLHQ